MKMTTTSPASGADNAVTRAIRGRILHFLRDPQFHDDAYQYWEDGVMIVKAGRIAAVGNYADLSRDIPQGAEVVDHRGKLIVPGFIDTHIHYPQTDIIASPSPGLLHWLDTYTFPEERRFSDPPTRGPSPISSPTNCCATARPPQWSGAPCTRHRPTHCSPPASNATCA
jgi:guanine deaminase